MSIMATAPLCLMSSKTFASPDPHRVAAIVVTYNRKELLAECLRALLSQTQPLATILVINNVSTDGTLEMLAREFPSRELPQLQVVTLPVNAGGAGGFHAGMQQAAREKIDWLWLMDDDTIPEASALAALLRAYDRLPAEQKPRLLASRVNWTDGSVHHMNLPIVKRELGEPERVFAAAEIGAVSIRYASFVSLLVQRSVLTDYGLPHADYFIWRDDTEYTARVLRCEFGVMVGDSVVTHKTARKHSPLDAGPERSYYYVRNSLWMILRSPAWDGTERVKVALSHAQWIFAYLRGARFGGAAVRAVLSGIRDGLLKQPAA